MKQLTKAQLEKFLTIPSDEPVLSETQIAKALSNNETVGWKFDENADFKTNFYGFEHLLLRPNTRMEIGAYYLLHKYGKEAFVMFINGDVKTTLTSLCQLRLTFIRPLL